MAAQSGAPGPVAGGEEGGGGEGGGGGGGGLRPAAAVPERGGRAGAGPCPVRRYGRGGGPHFL